MAEHLGVDLHVISVDANAVDHFDKMVWHLDEPQGDPAPINVYFISKLAREKGIKVLLSGSGGDDIFSGYRRHSAQALEHYWSWLPLGVRRAMAAGSSGLSARGGIGRRLRKALSAMPYDGNRRVAHYYNWIAPETAAALVGRVYDPARDPLIQALDDIPAATHPLNKMLYLESRFFLSDHNLNYTDKMAMAVGVEVRVPFLDRDLVQFAAQLPVELKLHRGTGKWIFREAMRGILPDPLIDRPKTGFGAPVRHWLQSELRGMVDALTAPGSRLAGILDLAILRDLIARDRAGQIDAAYTILGALALESWLRQFAAPRP
jgi:asparagine synthase (glutamine-hydrolysing)